MTTEREQFKLVADWVDAHPDVDFISAGTSIGSGPRVHLMFKEFSRLYDGKCVFAKTDGDRRRYQITDAGVLVFAMHDTPIAPTDYTEETIHATAAE